MIEQLATRRGFLRFGLGAAGFLNLPGILRLRAAAAAPTPDTAVIFVMLGGGMSHLESYDPKPDAPVETRGPCRTLPTSVPGIRLSELLPRHAELMHRLAVVRSIHHAEASHIALHMVESGYFLRSIANARRGEMPSVGSVVARVRGAAEGLPAFVSLPRPQAYSGPAHLGGRYGFFAVDGDPSTADFRLANLDLPPRLALDTVAERRDLLRTLDEGRRLLDTTGQAESLDAFRRQALELVTGDRTRTAFNLGRESPRVRDAYGRNALGQRLLLARRLVEAGVPFVNVRTFDWDDHQDLETKMRARCPAYDRGLAGLVRDLHDRGLAEKVLVVAMGEFGRTPRINPMAGRDHWPAVMSVLLAGGRYRMGQAIGASDGRGAAVTRSPYRPQSVLGMLYRHLGIDPALTFPDFAGRPRHVLEERTPIRELL